MNIIFLSAERSALKLNGEYVGVCDLFERICELDEKTAYFAEVVPEDKFFSHSFFIDENFFKSPPPYINLYFSKSAVTVYIKDFTIKDFELKVINQTRFCGYDITIYKQCGVKILIGDNVVKELAPEFEFGVFNEIEVGGFPLLTISANGWLCCISKSLKTVYCEKATSFNLDEGFTVICELESACKIVCKRKYLYDGNDLLPNGYSIKESVEPSHEILPFAFFESVLYKGDFARYLSDDLKGKSHILGEYLGNFCAVAPPCQLFYTERKNPFAVCLAYLENKNIYRVKYFAVDINNGKICNVYPVE
ncbi:MAG: hypothetical protein J6B04_01345 [Clostridia bacterium]|nr:hypothetical protein [Clostridia bacterium]